MTNVRRTIAMEFHRPVRLNFARRAVDVKSLHDLYQADLVEMITHAKSNKGYKYLMTVINAFSKYTYVIPLKTKTEVEVSRALETILTKNKMKYLRTDNGKDTAVENLLQTYAVTLYSTYSEKKASFVERFNRTLKTRMYRAFSEQGHYGWLALLPELVNEYSNSVHRTIGIKPCQVNISNERIVLMHKKLSQ